MIPRIVFSELSNRWYVLTRYREKTGVDTITGEPSCYLVASTKHDVTDQMHTIFASKVGRPRRRQAQTKDSNK